MTRKLLPTFLSLALPLWGFASAQSVELTITPRSSTTYKLVLPNQSSKTYTGKQTFQWNKGSKICVEKGSIRYDLLVNGKKKLSKSMFPDSGCESVWAPSPSFTEAVANYFDGITRFFLPAENTVTVAGSSKSLTLTTCFDLSTDVVLPPQYPFNVVVFPLDLGKPALLQLKDDQDRILLRQVASGTDTSLQVTVQDFKKASKYEVYDLSSGALTFLFEGKTIFGDWQELDFSAMTLEENMNWLLESQIQPYKVSVYNYLSHQSDPQSQNVAKRIAEDIRQAYLAYDPDTAFECNAILDEHQMQSN